MKIFFFVIFDIDLRVFFENSFFVEFDITESLGLCQVCKADLLQTQVYRLVVMGIFGLEFESVELNSFLGWPFLRLGLLYLGLTGKEPAHLVSLLDEWNEYADINGLLVTLGEFDVL